MKVELISIGDELLIGQTVNTNASYLAQHLTSLGLDVNWITTVGDDAGNLRDSIATAMKRSDVVIATGGLGPTHDDITKNVVADFFDSTLISKPEILERIKRRFERAGLKMAAVNKEQALVPEKAELIQNPVGTAPGFIFENDDGKCIVLPGVPSEMRAMCTETVFPMLKGTGQTIIQKTVRTTGVPESTLFERIGNIDVIERFAKVAFLPKLAGVDIRLTVKGSNEFDLRDKLAQAVQILQEKIGDSIYGHDEEDLQEAVARRFVEKKLTLSVAESCTGGLLANKLTNVSGSSEFFERGVVAYSNEAKVQTLGVDEKILFKHGAVSGETAIAMAEGIKKISGTDFGISTTGIAGPTGGTQEKPVGLVFIGMAIKTESYFKRFQFTKDRLDNKERGVQAALNLLRRELIKV